MIEPIDFSCKSSRKKALYKSFLWKLPLFSEFPERALDEVLSHSHVRQFDKKDLIFTSGAPADAFHVIVKGWVKLYRQRRDGTEGVFSVLTNTESFGQSSITCDAIFSYTAEAATKCEILSISSSFMMHMAKHHEDYDHFLMKFLREQMLEYELLKLQSDHATYMSASQRVGCFLLRMCKGQTHGSIDHEFPYEKGLMAVRLGMSAETFSRALSALCKTGVQSKRSHVTIQNIEQLRHHVCEACSATWQECNMQTRSRQIGL